jgi:hypothetical protein
LNQAEGRPRQVRTTPKEIIAFEKALMRRRDVGFFVAFVHADEEQQSWRQTAKMAASKNLCLTAKKQRW